MKELYYITEKETGDIIDEFADYSEALNELELYGENYEIIYEMKFTN